MELESSMNSIELNNFSLNIIFILRNSFSIYKITTKKTITYPMESYKWSVGRINVNRSYHYFIKIEKLFLENLHLKNIRLKKVEDTIYEKKKSINPNLHKRKVSTWVRGEGIKQFLSKTTSHS